MDERELFELIRLSSIPLREIGENGMPISVASACIADYRSRRLVLTVRHAVEKARNCAIEVKYEIGKGMYVFPLSNLNYLETISLKTLAHREIDFAYGFVPNDFCSYFQETRPPDQILSEKPRGTFGNPFNTNPSTSDLYGFSGLVMPNISANYLMADHRVFMGLRFSGSQGDFYKFKLPMRHPGHEYFKGCSGAPIIDSQGNPVALVCRGNIDNDSILGISLKKYQVAIDITIDIMEEDT